MNVDGFEISNLKAIDYYENCLNEFQGVNMHVHKKFSPKDLQDGLEDSILNQDWDSASLIVKEMAKYVCKSNQRAIWKAGMFIGLMHPNSSHDLMDTLCESALHFCETLRSEVILEHMIYYFQKHNFKKAIEIAEKLDKPKPGVKKRHENPMNEFESYRNCVILNLIKYYRATAELGNVIDSIYQCEGVMIRLPSLLNHSIPANITQSQNSISVSNSQSYNLPLEPSPILVEKNFKLFESTPENIENEGSAFLASQISGLLESWEVSFDAMKQDLTQTNECPEDDYQCDISASFLGLFTTPSSPTNLEKLRKTTLGGRLSKSPEKRRRNNRNLEPETEQFRENMDLDVVENNGTLEWGRGKRLGKACQSFENCLSTIKFVGESENFAGNRPYVAWDNFVDLHIGILLYMGNFNRAKEVLDHFITLYPSYYLFHEMACNLYSCYPQNFHDSRILLAKHQQVLLTKDPTNPRIFDLCHHLFEEQDYVGAARYLFSYMDCMIGPSTSDVPSQMQTLLLQLAHVCLDDLLLKRNIDDLWHSESFRSSTWVPDDQNQR